MTDCTAPRHDSDAEPVQAETNAYLCRPCRGRLRNDLARLPARYASLDDVIPQRGHGDGTGLPFNDPALQCRAQIEHDLRYWAAEVAADRRVTITPVASTVLVPFLCGWLSSNVKWIPFRAWAPHMAGALTDDIGRAEAILQPRIVKRITWMDPCPSCETIRELQATIYATEGDRRTSYIECLTCSSRWECGPDWMRMAAAARRTMRERHCA